MHKKKIGKGKYIAEAMILMRAFCNTRSDFHMENTRHRIVK